MIFAKVDVNLPSHHRFLRIPKSERAAAFGVWSIALCYTRLHELDGFVPLEAVESIASADVLARLVDVGLVAHEEQDGVHGVRLLRYAEHNETKADINKRLESDRLRKKDSTRKPRGRRKRVPSGFQSESVRTPVEEVVGIPDSDSGSDSGSGSREGEPERGAGQAVRAVAANDPIPGELREAAAMLSVQDIDGAWLKFCGHYAGQTHNVAGKWQQWCVNEAKRERTERDRRSAPRYAPPGAPDTPPAPYHATAKRPRPELDLAAQLAERQRADERAGGSEP